MHNTNRKQNKLVPQWLPDNATRNVAGNLLHWRQGEQAGGSGGEGEGTTLPVCCSQGKSARQSGNNLAMASRALQLVLAWSRTATKYKNHVTMFLEQLQTARGVGRGAECGGSCSNGICWLQKEAQCLCSIGVWWLSLV